MKHSLLEKIQSPADVRKLSRLELQQLATELRDFLLQSVAQTGGHLSSNLGTVELTIALHYVFNTPHDRLVWDVGHQTYPHKILTGRRDRMCSLRQLGGLSGFPQIAAAIAVSDRPDTRTIPTPPRPSGVAMATMVSCMVRRGRAATTAVG